MWIWKATHVRDIRQSRSPEGCFHEIWRLRAGCRNEWGIRIRTLVSSPCWYKITHGFLWYLWLCFIRTLRAEISTDLFYKCKNGDPRRSDKSAQGHRACRALGLPTPCPVLPEDVVSFPRALMGDLFLGSLGSVVPVHLALGSFHSILNINAHSPMCEGCSHV